MKKLEKCNQVLIRLNFSFLKSKISNVTHSSGSWKLKVIRDYHRCIDVQWSFAYFRLIKVQSGWTILELKIFSEKL